MSLIFKKFLQEQVRCVKMFVMKRKFKRYFLFYFKEINRRPRLPDCFAERDPGPCLNAHKSWYYDSVQKQCQFFIYSGCGGNTNR